MFLLVSGDPVTITLEEPDNCNDFRVTARGIDRLRAQSAFRLSGIGEMAEDGTAWVDGSALRALAAGRVRDDWADRFGRMLSYASKKGWIGSDGRIQAHTEWD
jgi:hypothetical protein